MASVSHRPADRLAVYIDNSNLICCSGIDMSNSRLDYRGMVEQLAAGRDLWKVKLYDTYTHCGDGRISYLFPDYVTEMGIEGHFRDSFDQQNGIQKQIDTSLVADMTEDAILDRFDTAVLVSGDADMIPAVEKVRACGKNVEIASFRGSVSRSLRGLGRFIDLGDMCIAISREPRQQDCGGDAE